MAPLDTSAQASAVQRAVFARMSPEERAMMALEMSDDMWAVALAGVALRHPDLSEQERIWRLVLDLHGVDLRR